MTEVFSEENRLIVLRTGLNQPDGMLLRSVLEAQDIYAFLANENVAGMNEGLYANLMVYAHDLERANAALQKVATMPRCAIPVRRDEDGEEIACRHCGSERVHPFEGVVPTIIPGVKITTRKGEAWYHCLQCDSYFKNSLSRLASIPVALMWGGALAGLTLFVIWVIEFLRWL
ncbi:MAG: hypothetical protein HWE25_11075 [Alphaproteobacteria bacterium]|nr:hypothetical protein [Alphaproteobacteria bacterium]